MKDKPAILSSYLGPREITTRFTAVTAYWRPKETPLGRMPYLTSAIVGDRRLTERVVIYGAN